jgi:putative transposase
LTYKAKIERFLRTLSQEVAHGTPGTTFSNIFERGDYNPEKYAVSRLSILKLDLQMRVPE